MDVELLQDIRRYVEVTTISPSVARGAGAPGAVRALRAALTELDLGSFATEDPSNFARALETATSRAMRRLPPKASSWGLARKGVNLFLREALYNFYLRSQYGLEQAEELFEVPLDSVVAQAICREAKAFHLELWPGLKHLTPELSRAYQSAAGALAREEGIPRIHLDARLWVGNR